MNPATLLLLCWVQQPDTNSLTTLSIYCGPTGCPMPQPGPICEVTKLEDAAIRHHQNPREELKLYEVTPTSKGATMKERPLPTLRVE